MMHKRDQILKAITRIRKRLLAVENFDVGDQDIDITLLIARSKSLSASIDDALVRTFGAESPEYNRYRSASFFDYPLYVGRTTPQREVRDALQKAKFNSIELLKSVLESLEELFEENESMENNIDVEHAAGTSDINGINSENKKIFIVHGHNNEPKESIARFIEKIGLEPIILHEQPNGGQTIIEKFENNANVSFAIVVFTPDDIGGLSEEQLNPRARQNVVLELGYFIGALGRNNVCAISVGKIEVPSDIHGILWIEFDDRGAWKYDIIKELNAVGFSVDANLAV